MPEPSPEPPQEPSLADLQAWMQGCVTAGAWGAAGRPATSARAAALVRNHGALSADARLDIYARSYVLRLAECLRAEYPVLRALIGEGVFDLFAGGYLGAHPSRSPSLYDLGAGFADYLEATRPRPHSGPGTLEALPASLARLERALSESSRAEGIERLAAAPAPDLAGLLLDRAPPLRPPDTLKLLALDFDFTGTLAAARAGERPGPPPAKDMRLAVARTRYRVQVHALEPWAFAWLSALRGNGGDAPGAVREAAGATGRAPGWIMARLMTWLAWAFDHGLLAPARWTSAPGRPG
jgi:hypothetical protein